MLNLVKRGFKLYLWLVRQFFELVTGVKLYKFLKSMVQKFMKFMRFTFISMHITFIVVYFFSTSHSQKWIEFHKNNQNDYFGYDLPSSAQNQLCYEWKLYKNSIIEHENTLESMKQKLESEEMQQGSSKEVQNIIDGTITIEGETQNPSKDNLNKIKREYEQYKKKMMDEMQMKNKEWQNWVEMDLICSFSTNKQDKNQKESSTPQLQSSSILLEMQVFQISQTPIKVLPLNVMIIDQQGKKTVIKRDVIAQKIQKQVSLVEKIFIKLVNKLLSILGIDLQADSEEWWKQSELNVSTEIVIMSNEKSLPIQAKGIILHLENSSNSFAIQNLRLEVIPHLQGISYYLFHRYEWSIIMMFLSTLIYIYIFDAVINNCWRRPKQKQE